VGDACLLVWRHDDGRVRAEISITGPARPDCESLDEKLIRELACRQSTTGVGLPCGVRVLQSRKPRTTRSTQASPDGTRNAGFRRNDDAFCDAPPSTALCAESYEQARPLTTLASVRCPAYQARSRQGSSAAVNLATVGSAGPAWSLAAIRCRSYLREGNVFLYGTTLRNGARADSPSPPEHRASGRSGARLSAATSAQWANRPARSPASPMRRRRLQPQAPPTISSANGN